MDEHFHDSQKLPKDKLAQLMRRSDQPAMLRFGVMYLLFLGASAWVVFSWTRSWPELIASELAFSIIFCSTFAAEHESIHGTAFQSKSLNAWAAWLAGLAQLYPSSIFRELHFTHHRYTHIPGKDPEISLGNKPMPSVLSSLPFYFAWLSGLPLLLFKIGMIVMGSIGMPESIRKQIYPFIRPEVRRKVVVESLFLLLFCIGFLLLAIFVHPGFWGLFVGQVLGHCLLSSYLTPEHNGLPHEGNIFNKTRSMHTNGLVRLLMWNMPYHAEHHAYPAVPFHALPQLHEEIKAEIQHQTENYPGFHLKVLSRKLK